MRRDLGAVHGPPYPATEAVFGLQCKIRLINLPAPEKANEITTEKLPEHKPKDRDDTR